MQEWGEVQMQMAGFAGLNFLINYLLQAGNISALTHLQSALF
jgi:hypothetical protein